LKEVEGGWFFVARIRVLIAKITNKGGNKIHQNPKGRRVQIETGSNQEAETLTKV
jgi:hypothetical protein